MMIHRNSKENKMNIVKCLATFEGNFEPLNLASDTEKITPHLPCTHSKND
jgi:hypothetical protein